MFSGVPSKGDKNKIGYLTYAISGAHKRAEMLRNLYVLGGPRKGDKTAMATSPLPARGPTSGRNCYVTLTFLRIPIKGEKIRIYYLHLGPTSRRNCYVTPPFSGVPSKKDKMRNGYLTPSRKVGGIAT